MKKLNYYVAFIILAGFVFLAYTLTLSNTIDYWPFFFFLALSLMAESLAIYTGNERALSVGFTLGLTLIFIIGAPQACWISSLGIMLRIVPYDGKYRHILNTPIYKTLFNGSNILLSSGLAGITYESLGGVPGQFEFISIVPIAASIAVYIITNNILSTVLMSLLTGDNLLKLLRNNVIWVIRDNLALAPLGIIITLSYMNYGTIGVSILFGPLLLARYSFKLYIDMRKVYVDTVKALCHAVEAKDPYTLGHSERTSVLSYKLGERMGLNRKRLENLKIAAMLHDIGKIGVDEHILNKPAALTPVEFEKIKEHPVIGCNIIKEINMLKDVATIILYHHEKFNGCGYPKRITHNEIPLESCILSIVDVFDALMSDRPYRKAMSLEESLRIIQDESGVSFHPKLVDNFLKMIIEDKELLNIAN